MNPATSDLPSGHPNPPPTFYSIVRAGNEVCRERANSVSSFVPIGLPPGAPLE